MSKAPWRSYRLINYLVKFSLDSFLFLQVLMHHLIQLGHIVIPKSVSQHRLKENISVFDFKLTKVEMGQLDLLDQNKRTFDFGFIKGDMDPRKLPTYPEDMFD